MKTFTITEKDIEKLLDSLDCRGDYDWWYISRVEEWVEKLKEINN